MTARRVTVKLAAFFFAFVAAVALVRLFGPLGHDDQDCFPQLSSSLRLSENRGVLAGGPVTLDRENSRSYTRVYVSPRLKSAPDKLWVRTFFFSPDDSASRVWGGEAVELVVPAGAHESPHLTVAADCSWCADAPLGSYFARVQVSDGREETPLPQGAEFFDIKTAAPVVVHADRDSSRRR